MRKNKGISLIELVIALAIAGVLIGLSFAAFANLSTTDLMEGATQEILSELRQAQNQSVESLANSTYGVHFTISSATLFVGTTYQSGAAGNIVLNLPPNITASATPSDFVFAQVSGTTNSGIIQVYVSSNPNYSQTIDVAPSGIAEIQ